MVSLHLSAEKTTKVRLHLCVPFLVIVNLVLDGMIGPVIRCEVGERAAPPTSPTLWPPLSASRNLDYNDLMDSSSKSAARCHTRNTGLFACASNYIYVLTQYYYVLTQ